MQYRTVTSCSAAGVIQELLLVKSKGQFIATQLNLLPRYSIVLFTVLSLRLLVCNCVRLLASFIITRERLQPSFGNFHNILAMVLE